MTFATETIQVSTGSRPGVFDLTSAVADFCRGRGDGLCTVFVPHATAGVAIIEVGAGSDHDLMTAIDEPCLPTTGGATLTLARHGGPRAPVHFVGDDPGGRRPPPRHLAVGVLVDTNRTNQSQVRLTFLG